MKKILVVEGKPPLEGLDGSLFRRRECTLEVASTGKEALAASAKAPPDLVLFDARVEDVDPAGFVHALHARSGSADPPVLVVLAEGENAQEASLLRAGAAAVATRPLDHVALTIKACELLGISLRRHVRTFVKMKADASVGATTLFATIANISLGGVLLEGDRPLRAGDILKLSFFLPGDDDAITAFARVVRESPGAAGSVRRHGCQFIDLADSARDRIHAYVTAAEGD